MSSCRRCPSARGTAPSGENWPWNNRLVPNRKGVRQGCILSPCLFNLYVVYVKRNARLDEAQAGIKKKKKNPHCGTCSTPEGWNSIHIHTHGHTCACVCAQLCLTFCNSMDYSPPGSSVHEILQARILECVAISYPRGSS